MATTKALLPPSRATASRNMVPLLLRLTAISSTRLPSKAMGNLLHRCRRTTDKLRSSSSSSTSTSRVVRTATDSMPPGLLLTFMQVQDPLPRLRAVKASATARRRATASSTRRVQDVAKHFSSESTTSARKDSSEAASTMSRTCRHTSRILTDTQEKIWSV